jgi:hypothetical protein
LFLKIPLLFLYFWKPRSGNQYSLLLCKTLLFWGSVKRFLYNRRWRSCGHKWVGSFSRFKKDYSNQVSTLCSLYLIAETTLPMQHWLHTVRLYAEQMIIKRTNNMASLKWEEGGQLSGFYITGDGLHNSHSLYWYRYMCLHKSLTLLV